MYLELKSVTAFFRKVVALCILWGCLLRCSGGENSTQSNTADAAPVVALPSLTDIFSTYSSRIVKVLYKSGGQERIASGFFVSDDGYVVTSFTGGEDFSIETYRAQQFKAQKVGEDPWTTISLLKADLGKVKVDFFPLVSSVDYPKIGQYVISLSCKLGFNISPQLGYVTGLNDRYFSTEFPMLVVRSSLPIDGGDCGGAVVDAQGKFLGMLSHALQETKETFFIHQSCLCKIFQDLLLWGRARYCYAGLSTTMVFDTKTEKISLKVLRVSPASPAEAGGFLPEDIIMAVEEMPLLSLGAFKNLIFLSTPGTQLSFTVLRGEKTIEIRLKLGEK